MRTEVNNNKRICSFCKQEKNNIIKNCDENNNIKVLCGSCFGNLAYFLLSSSEASGFGNHELIKNIETMISGIFSDNLFKSSVDLIEELKNL